MIIPVGQNETILYGILKDVLEALSQSLNYDFIVKAEPNGVYGSLQPDGSYSGMLGAFDKKETDIGGPFVVSEQRSVVVDFTHCLDYSARGIMTGIESMGRNVFLYAKVFSWQVWVTLFVAIIGVAFITSLLYDAYLNEWKCNQFYLLCENAWVFFIYLLGKDTISSRKWAVAKIWNRLSFRILLAAWLLGPVINFVLMFQGSITSTFAVTKMKPVISDLEELTEKTSVIPLTSKGSAMEICFKTSSKHASIWERMKSETIKFMPETVEDALLKVERGTHVLIIDYIYALVLASKWTKKTESCKVQVEKTNFCQSFISLALRKGLNPTILRKINSKLGYINQAKLTDRWMNHVYSNYTHCSKQPSDGYRPLSIKDIFGGILIWGIGIVFSAVALAFEICSDKIKKKTEFTDF